MRDVRPVPPARGSSSRLPGAGDVNKIGRRRVVRVDRLRWTSREVVDLMPAGELAATTAIEPATVLGRWILWRPVEEPSIETGETEDDFLRNLVTIRRSQRWEVRFIGRRRSRVG